MIIYGTATQGSADATVETTITLPSLGGFSGFSIRAVELFYASASAWATADMSVTASIQSAAGSLAFTSPDVIALHQYAEVYNATGASFVIIQPVVTIALLEERLTVQPVLTFRVISSASGVANTVYARIHGESVNLKELEYLRLLSGGA